LLCNPQRSSKTKFVEFGRFAQRRTSKRGRKRPETIYFVGFTLYCTRNRKGNFRVGLRTEKSRLGRALMRLRDQMRRMRHLAIREQADCLNRMLRGRREDAGRALPVAVSASVLIAVIGSVLPAARAARVDIMQALRSE
jgi:hypothetical protein